MFVHHLTLSLSLRDPSTSYILEIQQENKKMSIFEVATRTLIEKSNTTLRVYSKLFRIVLFLDRVNQIKSFFIKIR